jgi:hypothetical protein
MPSITHHTNGAGEFDPDILLIMEDAYQRVCRSITATLSVKRVIAKRIVELIQEGERDPHTLCRKSLAGMDIDGKCE